MVHRVGDEARRRVGVAIAALNGAHRNMWRRGHAQRRLAVVAGRAIGVGRPDGRRCRRPAGEARRRARMTGGAVLTARRYVVDVRCGAERTFCALGRVGAVVAGVAPARAHRRMVHRVGGEARRRVGVAVAALNGPGPGCAAAWSCRSPWCRCGSSSNSCRRPDGRRCRRPSS